LSGEVDNQPIYSVSQINREIRLILEENLPTLWVEGEISNYLHHPSGHCYFSLKDRDSQLRCVIWRDQARGLSFTPQDGMKVLAYGQITVYERGGQYQLTCFRLKPSGVGELGLAFERLKRKLEKEGLFDPGHKLPLPLFPQRIGVVTSPSGAAIRDIIKVVGKRSPWIQIILTPVLVQGPGAAEQIAQAIKDFNLFGEVDLIIVGRGGGSIEDLWAFNEEVVARAIFSSQLPIISAVGHEIDFTISDFVADARAPTPSAAGELATRDREELRVKLEAMGVGMERLMAGMVDDLQRRLDHIVQSYGFRRPQDVLTQLIQGNDELERRLMQAVQHLLELRGTKLSGLKARLWSLGPQVILQRGYSICRKLPGREVVRRASQLEVGGGIEVIFWLGRISGRVETVEEKYGEERI